MGWEGWVSWRNHRPDRPAIQRSKFPISGIKACSLYYSVCSATIFITKYLTLKWGGMYLDTLFTTHRSIFRRIYTFFTFSPSSSRPFSSFLTFIFLSQTFFGFTDYILDLFFPFFYYTLYQCVIVVWNRRSVCFSFFLFFINSKTIPLHSHVNR